MHTGHSEYPGSARGGSSGQARKKHAVPDSSGEAYLSCPFVVVSFLRLVTNPQIFVQPSQVEEAWAFVDTLESRERAIRADIDPMTDRVFKHVYLVATAIRHLRDRGPGIRTF